MALQGKGKGSKEKMVVSKTSTITSKNKYEFTS
jgi:hypothetical protein